MTKNIVNSPQLLWLPLLMVMITICSLSAAQPSAAEPVLSEIPDAEAAPMPDQIEYVFQAGDTLSRVAVKYKVNLSDLRSWNQSVLGKTLQPGDRITVKRVEYPTVEGLASWYGPGFDGNTMANGEIYDMNAIIVAHRTLPLGTKVRVTNLENGKSIVAPVLDRGPYIKNSQGDYTRIIDLSYGVAQALDTVKKGVVLARVEPLPEPWPEQ